MAGSYSYVKNLKCSLEFNNNNNNIFYLITVRFKANITYGAVKIFQEKICLRVRTTRPWCQAKSRLPPRFHQLRVLKVECVSNCNRFHGQMYYVFYRINKSTLDQASWPCPGMMYFSLLSNISIRMSKNVIKQSVMRLICSPNKQVLLKADLSNR